MRSGTRAVVNLCLVMLLNLGAYSTVIHVDQTNESGTEDGSELNPFSTVQAGVDDAAIGDTVLAGLSVTDEVAYLRFASVYKEFTGASDFEREMAAIKDRQ